MCYHQAEDVQSRFAGYVIVVFFVLSNVFFVEFHLYHPFSLDFRAFLESDKKALRFPLICYAAEYVK